RWPCRGAAVRLLLVHQNTSPSSAPVNSSNKATYRSRSTFFADGQGGWCGGDSPFGNGERHRLASMVVASGCAFAGQSAAFVADADNHRYLHAQSCLGQTHSGVACLRGQSPLLARRKRSLLCSTVAPALLLFSRRAAHNTKRRK